MAIREAMFKRCSAEQVYQSIFRSMISWDRVPNRPLDLPRNLFLAWQKDWIEYYLKHGQEERKNRVLRIDLRYGFTHQDIAAIVNPLFIPSQKDHIMDLPSEAILDKGHELQGGAEKVSGHGTGLLESMSPVQERVFGIGVGKIPTAVIRCVTVNPSWPVEYARLAPDQWQAEFTVPERRSRSE